MTRASITAAVVVALSVLVPASAQSPRDAPFEMVERGRYLAVLGDCAGCHSLPGQPPFAGGVVLATPFGNLVGANITPDRDTGIGDMTLEQFQRVMSEGIGRDGRHLYAAMPFPAYTKVTKDDNAALWSYLQTLAPVHHPVQTNQLPFPFNIRLSLIGWNWLNFSPGEFRPNAAKSAEWNRGAYLVEGLGHCGACHTPKTLTGGDKSAEPLQGATLQGWFAPNITSDPHRGIGAWSVDDIVQYLKTGANRFDIATGPMAEAVENSTQYWTDADLRAAAAYLKDTPAGAPPTVSRPSDKQMTAGRNIYTDRCEACHVGSGEGIPKLFPRLAKAPLVNSDDPTSLIRVVLAGSQAGATDRAPTAPAMPAYAWNMTDDDVANVLTYIRNSWGNSAGAVDPGQVTKLRGEIR